MKRIPIRYKLLAALLVPVLAVAAVTFTQVRRADNDLKEVQRETNLALAAGGPGTLITAVMDERNVTGVYMIGLDHAIAVPRVKDIPDARGKTDRALVEFNRFLDALGPEARSFYAEPLKVMGEQLPALRKTIDDYTGVRGLGVTPLADVTYEDYSTIAGTFHEANYNVARQLDDSVLRDRSQAIADLTYVSDLTSRLARASAVTTLEGRTTPNGRLKAADLFSKRETAIYRSISLLEGTPAQELVTEYANRPAWKKFREMVQEFLETDQTNPTEVVAAAADPTAPTGTDAWEAGKLALETRANELVDDAEGVKNRYTLVFVVSTLLALGLALAFASSIARPLLSLTKQADDMANERLPEAVGEVLDTPLGQDVQVPHLDPITVKSHDEVADVAGALTTVQNRALDLAVEQAVLRRNIADSFVNLGRRTQNLVGRQLDFITQLEQDEADPETLENLFRLDHLATRIRRNAESLVVLAGLEPPRTWSQAVPMVDALRSSLGEVEDYQRVQITNVDPAMLAGGAAADLVHLLAELVENGLTFSPPDRDVEVTGRRSGSGYRIEVVDRGIGMSADDLAQANIRLAGTESFTVAPSKYLGHYVAGHLARRLGATVALRAGADGGVTAEVVLPAALLEEGDVAPTPPPADAVRPTIEPSTAELDRSPLLDTSQVDHDDELARLVEEEAAITAAAPVEVPAGVAAPAAPAPPAVPEVTVPDATAGGLTRRVRGENLPTSNLNLDRSAAAPEADTSSVQGSKAEQMRSMLSQFSAGAERARSEGGEETDGDEG